MARRPRNYSKHAAFHGLPARVRGAGGHKITDIIDFFALFNSLNEVVRGRPQNHGIFIYYHCSFGWFGGRGRPQNHRKQMDLQVFSWIFWSCRGPRAAPESQKMYSHAFSWFLCWVGVAGGPRVMENTALSIHFHCLLGGVKARMVKESLKIH